MNSYVKLKVVGVDVYYKSYKALSNIEFEVKPGEVTSILGPNGSGKTTLLRTIAKVLKPRCGTIYLDSKSIYEIDDREYAKIVGYLPQQQVVSASMKVFDVVALGRRPYVTWTLGKRDLEVIWNAMKLLEVDQFAYRNVDELSGGERQRVMCARVLAQEPRVLLLDEPVTHLDLRYQIEFLELVKKLTKERNLITIMSLHDLNLAMRYSDEVILMRRGLIYSIGKPDEVLTPQAIRSVFGVEVEIAKNPEPYIVIKGLALGE